MCCNDSMLVTHQPPFLLCRLTQYSCSKLCNILHTRELQDRYQQSRGVIATSVSPGFVNTTIFRYAWCEHTHRAHDWLDGGHECTPCLPHRRPTPQSRSTATLYSIHVARQATFSPALDSTACTTYLHYLSSCTYASVVLSAGPCHHSWDGWRGSLHPGLEGRLPRCAHAMRLSRAPCFLLHHAPMLAPGQPWMLYRTHAHTLMTSHPLDDGPTQVTPCGALRSQALVSRPN
jgi:hypothetical protein